MVGDPSTTTTPCVRLGRRRRREESEQLEQPRREAEDAATPGAWASDVASRWRPLRRARDQDLAPSESAVAGYEAPSRARASGVRRLPEQRSGTALAAPNRTALRTSGS